MEETAIVKFYGQELVTIKTETGVYVAMKPVVEGMGLDWRSQARKIQQNQRYGHITIPLRDKQGYAQEMICIPLEKLNGWLLSVNSEKVKLGIKGVVIRYQEECFQALYEYWFKGKAENPRFKIPKTLSEALQLAAKQAEELQEAEPKIKFFDQVEASIDSITVVEYANLLTKNDTKIGQNILFKFYYEYHYLINNIRPYQTALDAGLFEIKEIVFTDNQGRERTTRKVLVTGKGQTYFAPKIKADLILKSKRAGKNST